MNCSWITLSLQKKERMESLKQRRTIRKYQQKDISADLLNDLLETSFRASTVGNMQVYSVIVTRDAERKAKLAPAHFNQPMVRTAPVVLTFCIDLRRFSKWCEQRKAEPGYNNFEWFVTGACRYLAGGTDFFVWLPRRRGWAFAIWELPLTTLR